MDFAADLRCLERFVEGALDTLRKKRDLIDNLNVYPVPDGDTGTNLYTTLLIAAFELRRSKPSGPLEAFRTFASGAVQGARGNSGFIISQFLVGTASAMPDDLKDGEDEISIFATAVEHGVRQAYAAVIDPVEGTVLTVLRRISESLKENAGLDIEQIALRAYNRAAQALLETSRLLPALRDAGVVDAGGAGVVALIEGGLESLGMRFEEFPWVRYSGRRALTGGRFPSFGVRLYVDCSSKEVKVLRDALKNAGESLIVAGSQRLYKIHIHTDDPETVLKISREHGVVSNVSVTELLPRAEALKGSATGGERVGVISLCDGEGLKWAFLSIGVSVVPGGPGNHPAALAIAKAIESMDREFVIILPNEADLISTCRAALKLTERNAEIVPSVSPVQGLSACDEFFEEDEPLKVFERMVEAAAKVRHGRVVISVRDAVINGLHVREGEYLGFAEGIPVDSGSDIVTVARSVIERLMIHRAETKRDYLLLTIVYGEGVSMGEVEAICEGVRNRHPCVVCEPIEGGVTGSSLIIGVE